MDRDDEVRPRRKYVHQIPRYPVWVCPDCGYGIPSIRWRKHRRLCTGHETCPACDTPYPCRNNLCPKKERPNRVEIPMEWPGLAPRKTMVHRMLIEAVRLDDKKTWRGRWTCGAWVTAPSWPALYELLLHRRKYGLP